MPYSSLRDSRSESWQSTKDSWIASGFALAMTIFISANVANLYAVELNQIITNCQSNCTITTNYDKITNSGTFVENRDGIRFGARITEFINYGNITKTSGGNQIFGFESNGYVAHFINYGTIGGSFWISNGAPGMDTFTNYGILQGGISHEVSNTLTINNFGIIAGRRWSGANINNNNGRVAIQNYTLMINENPTTFNNYTGSDSSAHLVLSGSGVSFKNKNSRIYLDFGENFEFGKEYAINKVATNTGGATYTALGVDFSRLSTRNDIYTLSKSGDNFVVSMNPQYGTMGMLYKSNIKTMINLYLQSNNMIYPHKYKKKRFGNANPPSNNYRRVRGMSNLFRNPHSIYVDSIPTRHSELSLESEESTNLNNVLDSFALDSSLTAFAQNDGKSVHFANNDNMITTPLESNELFFYDNEWLLSRDNANARKVNMDYTHSVRAVNNSNVSKDAYYNKGAYKNKIITNDTRSNEINQYQSTNRQGNVSRAPNQNNRHLANQSNNPCGTHKCIYIYKPKQTQQTQQLESKPLPKPTPKVIEQPKIIEPQPKEQPKIQPQPKPIQAIRPTMPPPPKIEPKPLPKVESKIEPKAEPKVEPKVIKVESKPTPPKPKVIIQDPYYFILTPFVAHNFFYESGRYNVSGLEYGFITAFSGKITNEHILGLHFAFSYGSLKDSVDSIFNITSMNIMGGLNYKFDITNDMYLKARVDIFYFLNQVQSTMTSGNIIKPNNLGFGASVAYGKEWDFDRNGILGLEVALDYKGLMGNAFSLTSFANTTASYVDSYDKALYNMLYVDLGVNYDKYFESSVGKWGLDTGLGIKGNITANALAKSRVSAHNNARVTNMTLDNDRFIAYLNIGGSYLLERKDFDMEFSLAYYGNYGDRTMSNGGGFEWRVVW